MSDVPEEVTRLLEAIEAFAALEDDEAAAVAVSNALDQWPEHHARLREIRQQRVRALKDRGKTWQEIGTLLGVSASRAQQIGAGLRGTKRPPRKAEDGTDEAGTEVR